MRATRLNARTARVGLQIARGKRDVFCIPVAIFVCRPGEPDGRQLALSEISRCRPHKSTVDTAVGRAYTHSRVFSAHDVFRGFPASTSAVPTFRVVSLFTPRRQPYIHILKVIYCRITLTAQPGPKRIKETSPPLFLSFKRCKVLETTGGPRAASIAPAGELRGAQKKKKTTRGLASNAAFALKPDDHPGLACLSSHADLTVL